MDRIASIMPYRGNTIMNLQALVHTAVRRRYSMPALEIYPIAGLVSTLFKALTSAHGITDVCYPVAGCDRIAVDGPAWSVDARVRARHLLVTVLPCPPGGTAGARVGVSAVALTDAIVMARIGIPITVWHGLIAGIASVASVA